MSTLFPHKHLLNARQLSEDEIQYLFSRAELYLDFLRSDQKKRTDLEGVSIVLAFFENSTRTRMSFEIAATRLSAEITAFNASASSVGKGESLLDTVRNIESMHTDIFVMRHAQSGAHEFLASRIQSSLVNAGDGQHQHPTQGLLDAFTLFRKFGSLKGLNVCIVGDILHSRVARSNLDLLRTLGANAAICSPGTLIPRFVEQFGIRIFRNVNEALEWADVLNVLRIQQERMESGLFPSLGEYSRFFGIQRSHLERKPNVLIMHPGPINRGVELESEVADTPQSHILTQVEHGVAIRMAILREIAENRR